MENEVIKTLLAVESVIGVYRNYTLFSKKRKFLSVMRITIEMMISTVLTVNNAMLLINNRNIRGETSGRMMFFYHLMIYFTSFFLMVCGTLSSRHFEQFINNFLVLHSCLKNDKTYTKKLCAKKMKFLAILTLSFVTCVVFFALKMVSTVYWRKKKLSFAFVFLILSEVIAEIRFISEQLVFYTYMWMLHFILKSMNEYLLDVHMKCKMGQSKMLINGQSNDSLTVEEVQEWAMKYQHLVNCSKTLSACFKFQMLLSWSVATIHFVETSYVFFYTLILSKNIACFGLVNIVYVQIYLLGCTILVIYAGQRLLNEGVMFQRNVSKLVNTLITDSPSPVAETTTKLQLFVKINPIRIEYTNKLVLKMHLVPIILSLSATYIITILQFTHVI